MEDMLVRNAIRAALAMAAAISTARADVDGELVSLGKKTGVGARAISLGEAFTAVADDYSALYYNAAGMTQLSRSEVAANLSYGYFQNEATLSGSSPSPSSLESTRLNALTLVLTDGGRWALGLGYYVPISFDDPLYYRAAGGSEYAYDAQGQMDHYRLGLAYMISEKVSLGLGISAVGGSEQLEIRDGGTARFLEEYTGYNVEPSFLIHLSDMFSVGGSAVVLEQLELEDTYQEQDGNPLESVYDIHHPFQAKLGLAFQSGMAISGAATATARRARPSFATTSTTPTSTPSTSAWNSISTAMARRCAWDIPGRTRTTSARSPTIATPSASARESASCLPRRWASTSPTNSAVDARCRIPAPGVRRICPSTSRITR
jgi:hypothetical protein